MAIIAATVAAALAEGLSSDEAAALGSFISTIGQALEHAATQIAICEKNTVTIRANKGEKDTEGNSGFQPI